MDYRQEIQEKPTTRNSTVPQERELRGKNQPLPLRERKTKKNEIRQIMVRAGEKIVSFQSEVIPFTLSHCKWKERVEQGRKGAGSPNEVGVQGLFKPSNDTTLYTSHIHTSHTLKPSCSIQRWPTAVVLWSVSVVAAPVAPDPAEQAAPGLRQTLTAFVFDYCCRRWKRSAMHFVTVWGGTEPAMAAATLFPSMPKYHPPCPTTYQ